MADTTQTPMGVLELDETNEVGRPTRTYLITGRRATGDRVDIVTKSAGQPKAQQLLSVFLPSGYPHSVSLDYTSYQIYDSLQAFSSSIASLLASRAVLQGIGVGDENASATAAMLLSVLQESMGRIATIVFAHWAARRIEAECKMWRLAADIFNDFAFIMDCLSPSLPKPARIPLLCASSMSRALCGVAGGSSKAILSAHFAKSDNIGELNAKDSSQETVISLLGIWAGGALVSRISSPFATWIWLLSLLSIHLATNYAAVRAVSLRTLNRQRANTVFSTLIDDKPALGPEEVARHERVFERSGVLRWQNRAVLGTCEIGGSLQDLVRLIPGKANAVSGAYVNVEISVEELLEVFRSETYLLWFNYRTKRAVVVLSEQSTSRDQLKAWCHALQIGKHFSIATARESPSPAEMLALLRDSLEVNNKTFGQHCKALEEAGWDLSRSGLEIRPGKRLRFPA